MGTFSAIKLDEDKIIRGTSSKVIRCMCLLHYSLLFVLLLYLVYLVVLLSTADGE